MTVERTLTGGWARLLAGTALSIVASCGGGGGHGAMMAQNPDGAADAPPDASDDGDDGGDGPPININVTVDRCPTVVAAATPSMAPVGKPIAVNATGNDLDGDVLTYRWSASTGTFSMPAAAGTTFMCQQAGNLTLVVTVSDRRCDAQAGVPIICQAAP